MHPNFSNPIGGCIGYGKSGFNWAGGAGRVHGDHRGLPFTHFGSRPQLNRFHIERGKALTPSRRYIVDIWGKDITVFESQEDIDVLKEVFRRGIPEGLSLAEVINLMLSFAPALQFTLEDKENRLFIAKRFCLPGAVDEWRHIAGPDSLENLASEYVEYLGTESFHELL